MDERSLCQLLIRSHMGWDYHKPPIFWMEIFDVEREIFPPRFGTIRAYWVGLPAPRLLLLLLTPRHHGAPCVKSNLQRELLKNTSTDKQVNWGKSFSLTKTLTGPCCNGYFGKHWDIFFGLLSLIWCFSFSSSRFWFTSFFVINQPNHYTILHSIMGAIRSFLQLMPLAYPDINFYNKA